MNYFDNAYEFTHDAVAPKIENGCRLIGWKPTPIPADHPANYIISSNYEKYRS